MDKQLIKIGGRIINLANVAYIDEHSQYVDDGSDVYFTTYWRDGTNDGFQCIHVDHDALMKALEHVGYYAA